MKRKEKNLVWHTIQNEYIKYSAHVLTLSIKLNVSIMIEILLFPLGTNLRFFNELLDSQFYLFFVSHTRITYEIICKIRR